MSYWISRTVAASALMLVAIASGSTAYAGLLIYTATGGPIDGTLGATSFSNAGWSITATADTANIVTSSSGTPYYFLPTVATITIDGVGSAIFNVSQFGSLQFGVISGDYSADFGAGQGVAGFVALVVNNLSGSNGFIAGPDPGLYTNLATVTGIIPASSSVSVTGVTYTTSAGALIVTGDGGGPGSFSVNGIDPPVPPTIATPEPSTIAMGLCGALTGIIVLTRRRLNPAL